MNQTIVKIISFVFMIIMILNLVLFGFRIIGDLIFWSVIIVGALFAYVVLPKLKSKN